MNSSISSNITENRIIRKNRLKEFIKIGGAQLLTGMPEEYTKNLKIYESVTNLM
jgi:hypothetical protein